MGTFRDCICGRLTGRNVAIFAGGLAMIALVGTLVAAIGTLQMKDSEIAQAKASNEKMACWMLKAERPRSQQERREQFEQAERRALSRDGGNKLCRGASDAECHWWGPRYDPCNVSFAQRLNWTETAQASDGKASGWMDDVRLRGTATEANTLHDPEAGAHDAHHYWIGKVPHYGIDPRTGLSWGSSISGAEMVHRGHNLFLYGGWDPVTGARPWLLHADFKDVAKHGNLSWRYIDISVAAGVNGSRCPKGVYGHTMSRLGWDSAGSSLGAPAKYMIIGGLTAKQFQNESNRWGVLEIAHDKVSESAGHTVWRATWTLCGQDPNAARAFHTTVWAGGQDPTSSFLFICGGVRKKSMLPAVIWDSQTGVFKAMVSQGIRGRPCQRFGHTAVRIGNGRGRWILVMGGASTDNRTAREGLTWQGAERTDVHVYDTTIGSFVNPNYIPQTCGDAVRDGLAFARMHRSVHVGKGAIAVVGGGKHGGAGVALLRWSKDRRSSNWLSVEKLHLSNLQCGVRDPAASTRAELRSMWMPPLARHSMVAVSADKLVVYGGKVDGAEGFHGMMFVRLTP